MGLDVGTVLKRSVLYLHCNEDYLFTLLAIADNPEQGFAPSLRFERL
jgi:hypothetical protein